MAILAAPKLHRWQLLYAFRFEEALGQLHVSMLIASIQVDGTGPAIA